MSDDYHVLCEKCRAHIHIGQVSGLRFISGFSSRDDRGQKEVAEFLRRHSHAEILKLVRTESIQEGCEDEGSP